MIPALNSGHWPVLPTLGSDQGMWVKAVENEGASTHLKLVICVALYSLKSTVTF